LTYDSKAWIVCIQGESRTMAAEMKFMRRMADYTRFDYKNNLDIMKELNTQPIAEFIEN